MTTVLFLFVFSVLMSLVIGWGVYGWRAEFRRRDERARQIQEIARQMNFSYVPKTATPANIKSLLPVAYVHSSKLENFLHGTVNGIDVSVFDFRFHKGQPSSYTFGMFFVDTFVFVQSNQNPPSLYNYQTISPKGIEKSINAALQIYSKQHLNPLRES